MFANGISKPIKNLTNFEHFEDGIFFQNATETKVVYVILTDYFGWLRFAQHINVPLLINFEKNVYFGINSHNFSSISNANSCLTRNGKLITVRIDNLRLIN